MQNASLVGWVLAPTRPFRAESRACEHAPYGLLNLPQPNLIRESEETIMKPFGVVCAWVMLWANIAAAAGPVVFHVSDPVGPGETALLFGDGLAGAAVEGHLLADEPVAGPTNAMIKFARKDWRRLEVLQSSDLSRRCSCRPTGRAGPICSTYTRGRTPPRLSSIVPSPGGGWAKRATWPRLAGQSACSARIWARSRPPGSAKKTNGPRSSRSKTTCPVPRGITVSSFCPPISHRAGTGFGSITGTAAGWVVPR